MKKYALIIVVLLLILGACRHEQGTTVTTTNGLATTLLESAGDFESTSDTKMLGPQGIETTTGPAQSMTKQNTITQTQTEKPTKRPVPEGITPEVEKNKKIFYNYMRGANFPNVVDEFLAEETAKVLYTVGIPEIAKIDLLEVVIESSVYQIQLIDIDGQIYRAFIYADGAIEGIMKGEGENQEIIYQLYH